jgi:hypothetical protein
MIEDYNHQEALEKNCNEFSLFSIDNFLGSFADIFDKKST